MAFILPVLFFACKKPKDTSRTMTVTFFLKTQLAANQKLFVQYMTTYNSAIPYQYGVLNSDTLTTDSFSIKVNYTVPDSKMKGLAGYLKFTLITYQPWNHTAIAYAQPCWIKFGAIVNGTELHNYGRDGIYNVTTVNW